MAYGIDSVDLVFEEMKEKVLQDGAQLLHGAEEHARGARQPPHPRQESRWTTTARPRPSTIWRTSPSPRRGCSSSRCGTRARSKNVEKAILAANVGITPNNDGNVIRLIFPELTEERRKSPRQGAQEQCGRTPRVVLRNARRDAIDALEEAGEGLRDHGGRPQGLHRRRGQSPLLRDRGRGQAHEGQGAGDPRRLMIAPPRRLHHGRQRQVGGPAARLPRSGGVCQEGLKAMLRSAAPHGGTGSADSRHRLRLFERRTSRGPTEEASAPSSLS